MNLRHFYLATLAGVALGGYGGAFVAIAGLIIIDLIEWRFHHRVIDHNWYCGAKHRADQECKPKQYYWPQAPVLPTEVR